jgi:uncharacterized alpha-E superfamily protein
VLFQIRQLAKHFEHLPRERENAPGSGKSIVAKCLSRLNQTDTRELGVADQAWLKSEVNAVIGETLQALPKLSDAIAASYFAHSAISRTGRGSEQ